MRTHLQLRSAKKPYGNFIAVALLAISVGGCQTTDLSPSANGIATSAAQAQDESVAVKYYPSDEPLRLAVQYFKDGNFGLAERYYRDAVEKAPRDLTAWIGLAASYDRLSRFDLADRAYHAAVKLGGESAQILNNQGYSYLLRGDLVKARAKFAAALRRDPYNLTIANNIRLLDASAHYIKRPAI